MKSTPKNKVLKTLKEDLFYLYGVKGLVAADFIISRGYERKKEKGLVNSFEEYLQSIEPNTSHAFLKSSFVWRNNPLPGFNWETVYFQLMHTKFNKKERLKKALLSENPEEIFEKYGSKNTTN
jgi:hypothetical protein